MHALPCIFTLKLSHWWFVTLWIDIGLGIALYFTTRYSYATYSKANSWQSPGRTPGWWCQCSVTELQQPNNHHPHNPSKSTLHSLHFTSKHLDTMQAYVFGAAVSRSAAEHNRPSHATTAFPCTCVISAKTQLLVWNGSFKSCKVWHNVVTRSCTNRTLVLYIRYRWRVTPLHSLSWMSTNLDLLRLVRSGLMVASGAH